MSRYADPNRDQRLDPDSFAGGYFRNAVYRHWDPYDDISDELLTQDRERIIAADMTETEFEALRASLAKFGAGEEAVTEDLAPLMLVLEDINEQMFLSSQIYEEAKHTQFFDRYWREVIDPAAEKRGWEVTRPTDDRYFNEDYEALFDKTERAMHRLVEDESPEALARAFCHYHLAVESVLAQTGYWGLQASYSADGPENWNIDDEADQLILEGLIAGITRIRSDEGRHVGFGMQKVRHLVQEVGVDEAVVQETLQELLPHIAGTVQTEFDTGQDPTPLIEYASDKLSMRINVITDREAEVPPVEELVHIEGAERAAD